MGKAVLKGALVLIPSLYSLTSFKYRRREVLSVGELALKPLSVLNRPQRLLCLAQGQALFLARWNPGEIPGRGSDVTVPEAYFFLCLAPDT